MRRSAVASLCRIVIAVVVGTALNACSIRAFAQDVISPLTSTEFDLSTRESDPAIVPATFTDEANVGLASLETGGSVPPPPTPGFSDDVNSLRQLTADLAKRLAELEKSGKSRDEADAKKAGTFPTHKITGFLQLDSGYYSQT
ncbi:MAG TPA: hypothetical protein VGM98_04685, partial [Schlesneria sp.]